MAAVVALAEQVRVFVLGDGGMRLVPVQQAGRRSEEMFGVGSEMANLTGICAGTEVATVAAVRGG